MRRFSSRATIEIHRQTKLQLRFFPVEQALAFLLGLFLCAVLYRGANMPAAIQLLGCAAFPVLILAVFCARSNRLPPTSFASTSLATALLVLVVYGIVGLIRISADAWLAMAGRSYYRDVIRWYESSVPPVNAFACSMDAVGTTQAVWVAVAALAVGVGTLALRRSLIMNLLTLFVAIATFESVLGLLQYALASPSFLSYWSTPQERAVGTFINKNHFATWLAMSLPLVMLRTSGAFTFRSSDGGSEPGHWQAWWGFGVALIAAALLASGSRAGTAAAAMAALATLALLAARRMPGRRSLILLAIAVTTALFVSESIYDRFVLSLTDEALRESSAGRSVIYARAWDGAKEFFPYGAGLGSFSIAFPRFQPPELGAFFIEHVHNDYIQLLFEAGAVGVFVLAAFVAAAIAAGAGILKRGGDFRHMAPAAGCYLGAAAFAFHSWFDFPAHIPALAIAATFLFAAAIRLSVPEVAERRKKSPDTIRLEAHTPTLTPEAAGHAVTASAGGPRVDPSLEALFKARDPRPADALAPGAPRYRVNQSLEVGGDGDDATKPT